MFFSEGAPKLKGFQTLLPKCGACGIYKSCNSPKMEVSGEGRKKILVVGEAPGKEEDKRGRPFVGPAGQRLRDEFIRNGFDFRKDCWITNALICKPQGQINPPNIDYCRPNLIRTINELQPNVVIVLGGVAVRSIIPYVWNKDVGSITKWAGWRIPCRKINAWICPTFHPSFVLRSENDQIGLAVSGTFERHIKAALGNLDAPYETIPNEEDEVETIVDPGEAASTIYSEMKKGGLSSFDYETNMLKPDGANAEIVSCGICFRGKRTIAYPWHGEAIQATRDYLKSSIPKAGANIKFEQRWSKAKLNTNVRNWVWDSMVGAHALDCRKGITSVKFQSFVRMGTPVYNEKVEPYFSSRSSISPNRIKQIPLKSLLLYNGIDALVEWRLAIHQSREIGIALPGVA